MYDYSMKKEELMQKLLQSFILGYSGQKPSKKLLELISNGLGGVIFFADNLKNRKNFKLLTETLNQLSGIPMFFSIDQEGGLVERTIFLDKKNEYLTPKALSRLKNKNDIKTHYELLAEDLKDLGINLNFAPVLDVNTNPYNPIIGIRSFGCKAEIVNKFSKIVIDAFHNKNIICCGKHFAGHGDTDIDSHINMPKVSAEYDQFYKKHIICFENAIKNGIDTIMVSHVHFEFFDELQTPASLSPNAIEIYLKKFLNFEGLVITDDMVMGGIAKNYGLEDSILKALNAGVDVLIFRNLTDELINAIDKIATLALHDKSLKTKIINTYNKIVKFKSEKLSKPASNPINLIENQKIIDKIASKTIVINKKSNILPLTLTKNKNIKIVSFDNSKIYNLSNTHKLSDFSSYPLEELIYPIDPNEEDIKKITKMINNNDTTIFLSYNAHINQGQVKLFNKINSSKILVSCALDEDIKLFDKAESIISLCCYKNPSLKALAKILFEKLY